MGVGNKKYVRDSLSKGLCDTLDVSSEKKVSRMTQKFLVWANRKIFPLIKMRMDGESWAL